MFIDLNSVYRTDLKVTKGKFQFQAPKTLRKKFSALPVWVYYSQVFFSSMGDKTVFLAIDRQLKFFLSRFHSKYISGLPEYYAFKRVAERGIQKN